MTDEHVLLILGRIIENTKIDNLIYELEDRNDVKRALKI
jgi:hypothetical protein